MGIVGSWVWGVEASRSLRQDRPKALHAVAYMLYQKVRHKVHLLRVLDVVGKLSTRFFKFTVAGTDSAADCVANLVKELGLPLACAWNRESL